MSIALVLDKHPWLHEAAKAGFPAPLLIPLSPPDAVAEHISPKDLGKQPAYPTPGKNDGEYIWWPLPWSKGCPDTEWARANEAGSNVGLRMGVPSFDPHGKEIGRFVFLDLDTICDEPGGIKTQIAAALSGRFISLLASELKQPLWFRSRGAEFGVGVLTLLPNDADPGGKTIYDFTNSGFGALGKLEILTLGQQAAIAGIHQSGSQIDWLLSSDEENAYDFPEIDDHLIPRFDGFDSLIAAVDNVIAALRDQDFSIVGVRRAVRGRTSEAGGGASAPPDADMLIELLDELPHDERVKRSHESFVNYVSVMIAAVGAMRALACGPEDQERIRVAAVNWACSWEGPEGEHTDWTTEDTKWERDWSQRADIHIGWDYLVMAASQMGLAHFREETAQAEFKDVLESVPSEQAPISPKAKGSLAEQPKFVLNPNDPMKSAIKLVDQCHTLGGQRILHFQGGTFYAWAGSHYTEFSKECLESQVWKFLYRAFRSIKKGDNFERVPFNPNASKVANVIAATQAVCQMASSVRAPSWLCDGPRPAPGIIVACSNGLLDLNSGSLMPATPEFFTLNSLPFAYEPGAPEPRAWLDFLQTLWPTDAESRDALQEIFGLMLTGETRFQKAFLLVGPKRSGKSTIARVLTQLLGQDNVCGPTLSQLGQQFGSAPLIGKRLAIIADARLSGRADAAAVAERILNITGEDSQTIDRKFREPWTGKLDTRLFIISNELPRLTDASGALASRLLTLVLTSSFYDREDTELTDKLLEELPGILNWAIIGWHRLAPRKRFVPPRASAEAQRELEDMASPITAFLRDRCKVGSCETVLISALYQAWCDWCVGQGRTHPGTLASFGANVRAALPSVTKAQPRQENGQRQRLYVGIGLLPQTCAIADFPGL